MSKIKHRNKITGSTFRVNPNLTEEEKEQNRKKLEDLLVRMITDYIKKEQGLV